MAKAKDTETTSADLNASALASDLEQAQADLAAAKETAAAAAEQLAAATKRADEAEKAAEAAQGKLADLEASRAILALARDTVIDGVPRAVGTRVAVVSPEPGIDLAWLREAFANGTVRVKG